MSRILYLGLIAYFIGVVGLAAWVTPGLRIESPTAATSVPLGE